MSAGDATEAIIGITFTLDLFGTGYHVHSDLFGTGYHVHSEVDLFVTFTLDLFGTGYHVHPEVDLFANVSSVKDLEVFKIELNKDFLSKMPDKPPVKGYSCENNNSLLEWCSSGALLSGWKC
ncbi:unnamed protein product [Boreogadus saida]